MNATHGQGRAETQGRQKRRLSRTRKKILDAARSVFSEKGLATATVEEIASRADVGRGTFYYHFTDKEDAIQHSLEIVLEELTAKIEAECKDKSEIGSVLNAMISAHIRFFSRRWEDFVLYYQGRADLTLANSYEGLETPFLVYLKSIERLIDGTIAQPISEPKLRRLACAIAGFISGYYSFASVATDDEDIDSAFMSLRGAFVASLTRFVTEALPDR